MDSMNLPRPLASSKSWTEELPDGAIEQSTGSFGYDFGQKVLNIKIRGGEVNLRAAIKYIVGYSQVLPRFNPAILSAQGPYRLNRVLPARHPYLPGLRATKILSCTGRGIDKAGPKRMAAGTSGNWEYTYLSILFEIPKYPMIDDSTLAGRPEYVRYSLFDYDTDTEVIARKGQEWWAPSAQASAVSPVFVGDRTVREAKGILKITTFDVHEDYIKLGRLVPQSHRKRTSTVNARAFPREAYLDQNYAPAFQEYVRFGPGELLLLPTKITPHTQCHPAVLDGSISDSYFPRTVDVGVTMIHFAPETDDPLTVDLSSEANYGPDDTGLANVTPVRGHQLAALYKPSGTGYVYYGFVNNARPWKSSFTYGSGLVNAACIHGGVYYSAIHAGFSGALTEPPNATYWAVGIKKPNCLLYPYSDFEKLWAPVESINL